MLVFGVVRVELTAILWGAVFLGVMAYSFLSVLVSFRLRSGASYAASASISPRECGIGFPASVDFRAPVRFRLPGVRITYEVPLRTADGRTIDLGADPEPGRSVQFRPSSRGAYRAGADRLTVSDPFGFFSMVRSVPAESSTRLSVISAPETESLPELPSGGGAERRTVRTYRKTDDLTESRKYAPGDDPRRINWKLYGHIGELFVRDGESEPPPRSRVSVVVDGSFDPVLQSLEAARGCVDVLAARALGLTGYLMERGFDVSFGCSSSPLSSGDLRDAAVAFSAAAAEPLGAAGALPETVTDGDSLVLFALPRETGTDPRLERLAAARGAAGNPTLLLFLSPAASGSGVSRSRLSLRSFLFRTPDPRRIPWSDSDGTVAAAMRCAQRFDGKRGVRARTV